MFVKLSAFLHLAAAGVPSLPSPANWWSAVCRGTKLNAAMQLSESTASTYLQPITTPWDGFLRKELAEWGYTESSREQLCDFDDYWHMEHIFKYYQMNPKAGYRGGDNICFDVRHGNPQKRRQNGEPMPIVEQTYTVNGKQYRATDAFATIGINAAAGHIFFIACKSASYAARQLWGTEPSKADLPALRSLSHIAWGFWSRMHSIHDLHNIHAFWSLDIVNRETNAIINRAHTTYSPDKRPPPGKTLVWPGVTFSTDSSEGQAILGSPNGIAAGYFLAQHKRQLGGNKVIHRVTVFRVREEDVLPNLIFWAQEEAGVGYPGEGVGAVVDSGNSSFPAHQENYTREGVKEMARRKERV